MNHKAVIGAALGVALFAAFACSPSRRGGTAETGNSDEAKPEERGTAVSTPVGPVPEFVVFVDTLNLRAEPSKEAAVVTRLSRGARLVNKSEVAVKAERRFWRQVEAGGRTGWVADEYVLPALFYEAFVKADDLGRAGDGEGMIAAALEGLRKAGYSEDREDRCYRLSPDRRKLFVTLEYVEPPDWCMGYPDIGYDFQPVPVLYFVCGRGLVKYLFFDIFLGGEWTSDSRYIVYAESYSIELIDTEEWSRKGLGGRNYKTGVPDFEIVDSYVIWLSWEDPKGPIPKPFDERLSVPVLKAYDVDTGQVVRFLEADLTTLKDEVHSRDMGYYYYEIKMVATGLCPPDLHNSDLYKRFNGAVDLASF